MIRLNRCGLLLLLALPSLLLVGCASMVDRSEYTQVKTIAVVSLYADEFVPDSQGRGHIVDWGPAFRASVAEDALNAFNREFFRLGWDVVSSDPVLASPTYQKAFGRQKMIEEELSSSKNETENVVITRPESAYFSPGNMLPITLEDVNIGAEGESVTLSKRQQLDMLGQMARDLKVDAVALVYVDYCYQDQEYSSVGTGLAVMTASSTIRVVNQAGDLVIDMPMEERCAGDRGESRSTATMYDGNLEFEKVDRSGVKRMFSEATRHSALISVTKVREAVGLNG